MFRVNEDPIRAYTHAVGAAGAIVALVLLATAAAGDVPKVVSMALFGSTAVLLFTSSSVYHFLDIGERGNRWLKRLDHAAIFLFIAGTYVGPLIHTLDGAWRVTMLSVMGGIAILGVVFKVLWVGCPRWLSAGMYLAMGWMVVIPGYQVFPSLTRISLLWLVLGGLAYSAGAVIYARKRPDPWPGVFGHHEIWHLFVLAGAGTHALFMATLLSHPVPPFDG